jgi:hypothetical protein
MFLMHASSCEGRCGGCNSNALRALVQEQSDSEYVSTFFVNNQLGTQFFFIYVYFYSLHVLGSHVPIIKRINCINMTSGICHSV